jgi:hypothetical protein
VTAISVFIGNASQRILPLDGDSMSKFGFNDLCQALANMADSHHSRTVKTPAEIARETAGLSLQQAAAKARVCPRYLRHTEPHGAFWQLARRLSCFYGCPIDVFLRRQPRTEGGAATKTRRRRGRSRRRQSSSPKGIPLE